MNEENFIESLIGLEGIKIGLFLMENQYVEGILLQAQEDHLTVKVEDNTFYFPINQIKAITKKVRDSKLLKPQTENEAPISAEQLEEILNSMRLKWVTINSFENQSFAGVLYKVSEDYILLLNGDDQYFIRKSHITNIFQGHFEIKQEVQSNEQQSQQNEQSSKPQNENAASNAENPQDSNPANLLSTNMTPSEKNKNVDTKKTHEFLHLKEVKFNSPMEGCTWNKKVNHRGHGEEIVTSERQFSVSQTEQETLENVKEGNTNEQPLEVTLTEAKVQPSDNAANENLEQPMIMEDNRKLIEKQYYALMKFAESMHSLEKQYQALMRHAEKMYLQLRKNRKL